MDSKDKARKVHDAANKLAAEYETEGKPEMATRVSDAFASLPADSAARLYDLLNGTR